MEILIIQILRMGDALQLVPLMQGIKELFPESRLSLLTSRLGAGILSPQPEVDDIFVLEKTEIAALMETGTKQDTLSAVDRLAKNLTPVFIKPWDWVINFSYSFATAQLSFLIDAKHRSGFTANKHRQYISKEKWFAYSMASFVNRRYSVYNWVDINRHILGLRGLPHPPVVTVSDDLRQKAVRYLKKNKINTKSLVGLVPGASGPHKRWPAEKFGRLGRVLVERHAKNILIFGDDTERTIGNQVKQLVGAGAINLAGETSLEDLKTYLSLCDVLVTNDTGPMHLAAAVATPTIGLFFSTHFVETGPYGAGHLVLHPAMDCFPCQNTAACEDKYCLDYITPETVEQLVVNGKELIDSGRQNFLGPDIGLVKAHFSDFDPWGNLQWLPVEKRPISFDTLQRLFLKVVWLYYADIIDDLDDSVTNYIAQTFARYDTVIDASRLAHQLGHYLEKLNALDGVLKDGQKTALAIQRGLLADNIDVAAIQQLGEKLSQKEAALEEIGGQSSLNFIRELTVALQENIEKAAPLDLSTKTIAVYRDMRAFAAGLAKQAETAAKMLSAGS
jgi:lipopolysaccharide heptosyltransferase II